VVGTRPGTRTNFRQARTFRRNCDEVLHPEGKLSIPPRNFVTNILRSSIPIRVGGLEARRRICPIGWRRGEQQSRNFTGDGLPSPSATREVEFRADRGSPCAAHSPFRPRRHRSRPLRDRLPWPVRRRLRKRCRRTPRAPIRRRREESSFQRSCFERPQLESNLRMHLQDQARRRPRRPPRLSRLFRLPLRPLRRENWTNFVSTHPR